MRQCHSFPDSYYEKSEWQPPCCNLQTAWSLAQQIPTDAQCVPEHSSDDTQCPCLTELTSWWTRGKQQSHTHFNRVTSILGRKGVNRAEIQWVNTTLERWGWHLIETWGPRMSPPQKEQGQRIPGRGNSKHKSLEAGKAQCFSFWEGRPDCLKKPLCAGCRREDVRHVWPKHAGPSSCLDFIPR